MEKIYILSACRTPIGKMGGALSAVPASELGALVVKSALERAHVAPEQVDHVLMGCVIQAGLGQNVARQVALKAGLPFTTTAETINAVCGSGLDCVNHAARMIAVGDAKIVVAGGTESMSGAPFALMKARYGYRMGSPMGKSELVDTMVKDALWDAFGDYHMGITAENVAQRYGLSREELDRFALTSQQKACAAMDAGRFRDEIVPVTIKGRKGDQIVDTDEGPRPDSTYEALARLKPAFREGGLVTAGNSSGINDGAAALVLAGEETVARLGLEPVAEWLGGALGGVDPAVMGIGPVAACRKLFKKLDTGVEEMELIEANEAFAAQSIAVARELGFDSARLNVNGGAIALGHPVGASGSRILVTLISALRQRNLHTGLATLCIGGGMGCATIIRRV